MDAVSEYWQRKAMAIAASTIPSHSMQDQHLQMETRHAHGKDVFEKARRLTRDWTQPHDNECVMMSSEHNEQKFTSTMWMDANAANSVQGGQLSQKKTRPRIFISLFDGISCGAQSIPCLNPPLNKDDIYIGVEIDEKKRRIADSSNKETNTFPGISRILGHDVTKITREMIHNLSKVGDIVCMLGGFPCKDTSWLRTRTGQDGRKPGKGERKGIFGTETGNISR